MAEDKPIRIDDAHYVNEATLELLKWRIESDVKSRLWRSLGIPAGSVGILAILYVLFVAIPQHIEKSDAVKVGLDTAVAKYLKDPERGQRFLQQQVEKITQEQVQVAVGEQVKAAVKTYFTDPQGGQRFVAAQINSAVEAHFSRSDAGRKFVQELVTGYLTSADGKKAIQDQVKRELEPRVASLLEPIKKNAARLVIQVEPLPEVTEVEKGTIDHLMRFLRSPEVDRLRRGSGLIALTKRIREGARYADFAIEMYLDELQQAFGARFRHVVLTDFDGFLARIDPAVFRAALRHQRDRLMRVLNADRGALSRERAQWELNQIFGMSVSDAIHEDWNVAKALRADVWVRAPGPNREVAVLGQQGRFIGTTTRDRLLATVLGSTAGRTPLLG
jgi:hypothetical protein